MQMILSYHFCPIILLLKVSLKSVSGCLKKLGSKITNTILRAMLWFCSYQQESSMSDRWKDNIVLSRIEELENSVLMSAFSLTWWHNWEQCATAMPGHLSFSQLQKWARYPFLQLAWLRHLWQDHQLLFEIWVHWPLMPNSHPWIRIRSQGITQSNLTKQQKKNCMLKLD